jgi:hypothetical protein
MAVPYTFANATTSIPLSQLDNNFATAITIGNTAVYLGNTTTSFGNVTLNNATIASGNSTVTTETVTTITSPAATALTIQSAGTTAMTINTSGNVGIGTSSPGGGANDRVVAATGSASASFNANGGSVSTSFGSSSAGYGQVNVTSNHSLLFQTNNTERMRIDTSGNLLVAKTSVNATAIGVELRAAGDVHSTLAASTGASTTYEVYSTGASAFRFYVDLGGTIHATSTSITAISDQSLKTNVKPLETGLAEVMRLQPRRFDWVDQTKTEGTNIAGFIAQEVEQILPDLVGSFKYNDDETKLGLKMGDMIPTLVKAIQELKTEFDAYKAAHP